jgi:NAD(P)-dependent dehydrogenase (short-subunit alcohol dehydrogenase family)
MIDLNLKDKTVFITGATRGIGEAIAFAFKKSGAKVIGTGTGKNTNKNFDEYFQADFSNLNEIHNCANYLESSSVDILINNAGIGKNSSFAKIDPNTFLLMHQVNVYAPFVLCKAAIPFMKNNSWGRIVNLSSIFGKISKAHRASYSATKFALDGLTLSLASEHAKDGILANCIAPGFTDTELTSRMLSADELKNILLSVPIGRMANVNEIANFVIWLASPLNSYISGQNIAIDGGFSRV